MKTPSFISTVELNEDFEVMLNCAIRYVIGSRTHITKTCSDYVLPLVPRLSNRCLSNINRALERFDDDCGDWGDSFNKAEWMKLWDAVKKQLSLRSIK